MVLSMHTHKIFPSCGCSSSVERQLPKLDRRVRLPSSAPEDQRTVKKGLSFPHSLFYVLKDAILTRADVYAEKIIILFTIIISSNIIS